MFVRLKAHLETVRKLGLAEASAAHHAQHARDLATRVDQLTDMIVQMKREGFDVAPESVDPAWEDGKYVIQDELPSPYNVNDGAGDDPALAALVREQLGHVFAPSTNGQS